MITGLPDFIHVYVLLYIKHWEMLMWMVLLLLSVCHQCACIPWDCSGGKRSLTCLKVLCVPSGAETVWEASWIESHASEMHPGRLCDDKTCNIL